MKSKSSLSSVVLLASYVCLCSVSRNWAADQPNSASLPAVQDDLGCDFYNGKTNKIVRISTVTPTHVWVIYEGGNRGRNIPRAELESPLKERYPYDAARAEEFAKQNADKTKALQGQQEQQRAAVYAALLRQEKELQSKIDKVNGEVVSVQKEIRAWQSKPKGVHGRGIALSQLIDKRIQLERHVEELTKQLEGVRKLQAPYR